MVILENEKVVQITLAENKNAPERKCERRSFSEEAAQWMRDDGRIEVTFDLSAERFGELQSALSQVFDGYGYYKTAA